jgi:hypothetical protein
MTIPLAVAGWVWTTSTVVIAVITLELLAVLVAHVLLTAAAGSGTRLLRRRLATATIPLLACFAAVIGLRLAMILIERPGP